VKKKQIHEVPIVSASKDSRKMCMHFAFCNNITMLKNADETCFTILIQLFHFVFQDADGIICSNISVGPPPAYIFPNLRFLL
jgi:hypothetical protein